MTVRVTTMMSSKFRSDPRAIGLMAGVLIVSACGDRQSDPETATLSRPVPPPGTAVTFTGNTIPTTMNPGERVNVTITSQNSGTVDWAAGDYGLFRGNTSFGWSSVLIDSPVTTGNSITQNFVITAPGADTNFEADFSSFISAQGGALPGSPLSIPITIDGGTTRQWDCAYVSDTIPNPITVNAAQDVSVTIQNTGQQTWPGGSELCLYAREDLDTTDPDRRRWGNDLCAFLASSVAPGGTTTLNYSIVAPSTPGTYRFMRQIFDFRAVSAGGVGYFDVDDFCVDESITVTAVGAPLDASVVSTSGFPASMAPDDVATVTITMQNDGTTTWPAGMTVFLYSRNSPVSQWGITLVQVPSETATGEQVDFTFNIRAPSVDGSYTVDFQMSDPTAFFGAIASVPVTVSGVTTPALDASEVSNAFPATMAPDSVESVTVTMQNDGTTTWTPGTYFLASTNSPTSLWGITSAPLPGSVATGASATFTFNIRAPSTPGATDIRFQMFSTATNRVFGAEVVESVNVDGASPTDYDSSISSQTIPGTMVADSTQTFTIVVTNDGAQTWLANSTVDLVSANSPTSLWGATSVEVPSDTATGEDATFTFSVTAPSSPGTYASNWRMFQSGGIGFFGATAETTGITVTAAPGCGDDTVGAGETCDDGNTTAGDGCSATCQIESTTIDLASRFGDRAFLGPQFNKNYGAVTIADLNGDGFDDVISSDASNVAQRGVAGRVYVHFGSAGFFNDTEVAADTGADILFEGAGPSDYFGGLDGGAYVADVTGDGNADLIVGADLADGTGDARVDGGEVYVFPGNATLYAGGTFRLADSSATSGVGTVVEGAAAGNRLRLLAVGDVTNDGVADLIMGAEFNADGGADAGAVYVVAGSAGLTTTSTVDLSSATIQARLTGPAAGARLGRAAAVGDVDGDGINDLIVSSLNDATSGRSRAGAVYVISGPVSGTLPLSTASNYATVIIGEADNSLYGSALAVADFLGTSATDLVVGASQARDGGDQVGELHVWAGGVSTGEIDNAVVASTLNTFGTLRDFVGGSVAVGDTNGDGRADILTGAALSDGPSDTRADAGEAILLIGETSPASRIALTGSTPVYRIYGAATTDRLGVSRTTAAMGDIDGDGRDDWCVGSQFADPAAGGNAGRLDCFASPY